MSKLLFLALVVLLYTTGCASSRSSAERAAETQKAIANSLANRHLHINVRSMHPARYSSRMVSYGFYLELKGDTLESCLPYMGQVYQGSISSDGLNFVASVIGYRESRPKKGLARIELDARTTEDFYRYVIEIYDNGSAFIRVRGRNRDNISFDGDVEM